MKGLKKYKSFEKAGRDNFSEFYSGKFDMARAERFLNGFSGWEKSPYEPGLYKYKSFLDARKDDLIRTIERAVKRDLK